MYGIKTGLAMVMSIIILGVFAIPSQSNTKTLPKGVWMVKSGYRHMNITEAAGDTITNGVGDASFDFYTLENYTAKYISSLSTFVEGGLLSPDLQVVDTYTSEIYKFDIAYGLSDTTSIKLTIPFVKKTLEYSSGYRTQLNNLEAINSALNRPPTKAMGEGIGDLSVTVKNKVSDNLAWAVMVQAGFLKMGKDGQEMEKKRDDFESLTTGKKADFYTGMLFYDHKINKQVFHLHMGYQISTDGWENIFGQNTEVNNGDVFKVYVNTDLSMSDTVTITPQLTYRTTGTGKRNISGEWTKTKNSETTVVTGQLKALYKPAPHYNIWAILQVPIYNKAAGGTYDYPGRLNTDLIMQFGLTFFYK